MLAAEPSLSGRMVLPLVTGCNQNIVIRPEVHRNIGVSDYRFTSVDERASHRAVDYCRRLCAGNVVIRTNVPPGSPLTPAAIRAVRNGLRSARGNTIGKAIGAVIVRSGIQTVDHFNEIRARDRRIGI